MQFTTTNNKLGKRLRTFFVINCCAIFLLPDAYAEPGVHPFLTSKFNIQAGVYFPTQDLKLRVDGSLANENEEIDFDEELKLRDNDDVFVLEMTWRFGEKWSLRMQNFQENRRQSVVLEEDIEWGDEIIQAGSNAFIGSDFKITRVFLPGHSIPTRKLNMELDSVCTG